MSVFSIFNYKTTRFFYLPKTANAQYCIIIIIIIIIIIMIIIMIYINYPERINFSNH